ncbi:MAG: hypothetical protein PF588_04040 [Candidatus Kapabacteria bacterium]|jgi:hypothetical protein|nr:hypothetical protein [Candidatus Kapabacteria bacterium]
MSRYCVVNCMDGRIQIPVIEFVKENYGVEYVDAVTEAGPIIYLSDKQDSEECRSIVRRVAVSEKKNKSVGAAVVAHYDCQGNPLGKEGQLKQLEKSVEFLKKSFPNLSIKGLWVNEKWQCEEIY